jgi:hypothetical protein
VEVGGIDFSVWKIFLKALPLKELKTEYYKDLCLEITNSPNPLVNEVKKVGVIIDRGQPV